MKYLSLFSGIGAIELALGEGHECIGYSEIEKNAIKIYEKHFPNHKNLGDITKINAETIPDFDLLFGGFPEGWTSGIPSTQRKARLGNAITVNVAKAIVERIFG